MPMRNITLQVAYDGTDFVGSQWQNIGRSVQGELEGAWAQFTQEERRFVFAGRTDAGVHARGQVANVRTDTRHSLPTIQRGLNALLPGDISVLTAWEVSYDFHARHSAIRREYRYLIDNTPTPFPLFRNFVVHIEQHLELSAMQAALDVLPGRHDFAAFTSSNPSQGSTVRHCYHARISMIELFERSIIAIDLAANAFLHHMVRTIVGTLLLVGRGKLDPQGFHQILIGRNRRQAGPTAAAHGLTLMTVAYPAGTLPLEV